MSTLLDIKDTAISLIENGHCSYSQPGLALVDLKQGAKTGDQARLQARRQPSQLVDNHWTSLSTEPLKQKNSTARHRADLVWQQLNAIQSDRSKTDNAQPCHLVVSADLSAAQMQLLTGICQAVSMPVAQLADRGLLAGLQSGQTEGYTYLDLTWNATLISRYERKNDELILVGTEKRTDQGLTKLVDKTLYFLRDRFIETTRFDPLHAGETEQQLYDQLWVHWYQNHSNAEEIEFTVEANGSRHNIEVHTKELQNQAQMWLDNIGSTAPCLFDCAYEPLLSSVWRNQHGHTVSTDLSSALETLGAVEDVDTIAYRDRVRITASSKPEPVARQAPASDLASDNHQAEAAQAVASPPQANISWALLIDNDVYPLNEAEHLRHRVGQDITGYLQQQDGGLACQNLEINGTRVNSLTRLQPSDQIQLPNGISARLVRVLGS